MSLVHIRAEFACDGCGDHFRHELDPNYTPPADWQLYDVATDKARGGTGTESIGRCETGMSSVQGNMHLCPACTRKADRFLPETEDRDLTDAELLEALGL